MRCQSKLGQRLATHLRLGLGRELLSCRLNPRNVEKREASIPGDAIPVH